MLNAENYNTLTAKHIGGNPNGKPIMFFPPHLPFGPGVQEYIERKLQNKGPVTIIEYAVENLRNPLRSYLLLMGKDLLSIKSDEYYSNGFNFVGFATSSIVAAAAGGRFFNGMDEGFFYSPYPTSGAKKIISEIKGNMRKRESKGIHHAIGRLTDIWNLLTLSKDILANPDILETMYGVNLDKSFVPTIIKKSVPTYVAREFVNGLSVEDQIAFTESIAKNKHTRLVFTKGEDVIDPQIMGYRDRVISNSALQIVNEDYGSRTQNHILPSIKDAGHIIVNIDQARKVVTAINDNWE